MTDEQWSWGDIEVTPRTETVPLCLDGTLPPRLADARRRLGAAKRAHDSLDTSALDAAQALVDDLEGQVAAACKPFTIVAVSWREWNALVNAHQEGKTDAADRWNPETFIPAALAACCRQFRDVDAAADAVARLATSQIARLVKAVVAVNEGDDPVPPTWTASATTPG